MNIRRALKIIALVAGIVSVVASVLLDSVVVAEAISRVQKHHCKKIKG